MRPEAVYEALGDLPYMSLAQGARLGSFLKEHELRDCLELGFFHGVSSAYIAAALDDMGGGRLVTIDLESAQGRSPNIHEVLARTKLSHLVEPRFEPRGYSWHMMRMLEENTEPRFDFCYLDGGHTWDATGFGFFLVSRLLRPGGWLLFDDLDWRVGSNPSLRTGDHEFDNTPQVRRVFELLVKTSPDFDAFREEGGWGFARKRADAPRAGEVRTEVHVLGPREVLKKVEARGRRMLRGVKARVGL